MIELNFTHKAQKFYEQADLSLVRRLNRCFEQLRQDPYSHANIKQLKGVYAGYFRYRVGDWRIIYTVKESNETNAENTDEFSQTSSVITIVIIAHRRDVYREN